MVQRYYEKGEKRLSVKNIYEQKGGEEVWKSGRVGEWESGRSRNSLCRDKLFHNPLARFPFARFFQLLIFHTFTMLKDLIWNVS
jgi:hypothetical protein